MRTFVITFATAVLLTAPAAADFRPPGEHPCVASYWLRAAGMLVGLNLPVGTVCSYPALGDPDHTGPVSHPAKVREVEPETPHCHEWKRD